MPNARIERQVERLLHDAEHADSGAMMAQAMHDTAAAARFREKRNALVRQALALDPERTCDAWQETTLAVEDDHA